MSYFLCFFDLAKAYFFTFLFDLLGFFFLAELNLLLEDISSLKDYVFGFTKFLLGIEYLHSIKSLFITYFSTIPLCVTILSYYFKTLIFDAFVS